MTSAPAEITVDLITHLLAEQRPELAHLPLRLGARGWDNQTWRLGDDLAVRLPWMTTTADEQLRQEHAWLPRIAPSLPLPVPVPQFLGSPSEKFPRPWLITTWVDGDPGDRAPATRAHDAATALAGFLSALHRPADASAPTGKERGRAGALSEHTDTFMEHLREATDLGLVSDRDGFRGVWHDAVAAPGWDGALVWVHGDLHPANILTAGGTLSGVIDWGDLFGGDPACDLAAVWVLLPDDGIDTFYERYVPAADEATRRRARGWAAKRALSCALIGDAGVRGLLGGKPTWKAPALATVRRLLDRRLPV